MPNEGSRDLILAPNEFAHVSNEANADIQTYVGPIKISLAKECQPVRFDTASKRFVQVELRSAIQSFPIAPEGWYLILKNPTASSEKAHPLAAKRNDTAELTIGRKINIPGPVGFALWPGQMVEVRQGHHLRSNQYLLVRVYDEDSARSNYKQAVIKPADDMNTSEKKLPSLNLTMGSTSVIQGTEVAFYIPPTGVEVIPDDTGNYVREAVTLERLEYAILLDENGAKSYPQGPKVVFPSPTQKFVLKDDHIKFRARELNPNMGIHIKVNTAYDDEPVGKDAVPIHHEVGEELFITGKETKIYFPREEHSIIKQGDSIMHYAVAIPEGEARYVLEKDTGNIVMIRGPKMYLPDPRNVVIVLRVLSEKQSSLWFPGNYDSLEHNAKLARKMESEEKSSREKGSSVRNFMASDMGRMLTNAAYSMTGMYATESRASSDLASDKMVRSNTYTPPRALTIDSKYDGAVCINVWPGYAVQVVRKTGEREVIVGPRSVLLEYDATLEVLSLSTGKPKTTDTLLETTYLQIKHNLVSDIVRVVTMDNVQCDIKVSYRVNFDGDSKKWFMVSNYVKYMCDHFRSMLRNAAKQITIEQLSANPVPMIRDTILGKPVEAEKGKFVRPLHTFEENGMVIYEVEFLDLTIGDAEIAKLLRSAQTDAVRQTLALGNAARDLDLTVKTEDIKRKKSEAIAVTRDAELRIASEYEKKRRDMEEASQTFTLKIQEILSAIADEDRARRKLDEDLSIGYQKARIEANVNAFVEKMKALSPNLIEAMITAGKMGLATTLAQNLPGMPSTLFGPQGMEALKSMVRGTSMEEALNLLANGKVTPSVNGDEVRVA
jgi:major vault protein